MADKSLVISGNQIKAIGSATVTAEGGFAVPLINKTGAASVKGTAVIASTVADSSFALCPVDSDDVFGIVYESGIADGSPCLVVMGGVADVLIEAADTIQRRYWARSATTTAGRVSLSAVIGGGSTANHFREVGHCLVTKANGGNELARLAIHFN